MGALTSQIRKIYDSWAYRAIKSKSFSPISRPDFSKSYTKVKLCAMEQFRKYTKCPKNPLESIYTIKVNIIQETSIACPKNIIAYQKNSQDLIFSNQVQVINSLRRTSSQIKHKAKEKTIIGAIASS